MEIDYEDSFVKVAGLIGGKDYVQVSRALLNNDDSTDEEIASATGLKINAVRKALYELFGRSLITGVRVRDLKKGWFVYRWRAQRDQVDGFIETQRRKALDRLKLRLRYEEEHQFYYCNSADCRRSTFEEALDSTFICPQCGGSLKLYDNDKVKKALQLKISQMEEELSK